MLAVRGDPNLYDDLEKHGVSGWSYKECLPHFKSLEAVKFQCNDDRGLLGPITISRVPMSRHSEAFHAGFNSLGVKSGEDYNSNYRSGVYQLQLTASKYLRSDASRYLTLVANRSKLTLLPDSTVHKLVIERDSIVAVEIVTPDGLTVCRAATVILCLGAVRTPLLLEKSGVGNPEYLKRADIGVVHRLDAVGENLKDHLMVRQTYESKLSGTINDLFSSKRFAVSQLARYVMGADNVFSTSSLFSTAFIPLSGSGSMPRLRVQLGLSSAEGRLSTNLRTGIDPYPGFHFGVYDISPISVGSVHVSSNPTSPGYVISPNYLSTHDDRSALSEGHELLDALANTEALRSIICRRTRPKIALDSTKKFNEYIASSAHTCWHPVGTCRMGKDVNDSVTTSTGKVHGLENLYVFDASIYPFHTSSNTNLPTLMAAEKLTQLFLASKGIGSRNS
jgi:choline dehydrogenase